MDKKGLSDLFSSIRKCGYYSETTPPCNREKKFEPVINTFSPDQKYLIISSDPSGDTNKAQDPFTPHSNFTVRFLSLVFSGDDDSENVALTRRNYSILSRIFDKYFYWTHFAKCYSRGNPNSFCANLYLSGEVAMFGPQLIIIIGNKQADFLMGVQPLRNRVNRELKYKGIPTFCSLHPSRDWNLSKRPQYQFYETWRLIRSNLLFSKEDKVAVEAIFGPQIFPLF